MRFIQHLLIEKMESSVAENREKCKKEKEQGKWGFFRSGTEALKSIAPEKGSLSNLQEGGQNMFRVRETPGWRKPENNACDFKKMPGAQPVNRAESRFLQKNSRGEGKRNQINGKYALKDLLKSCIMKATMWKGVLQNGFWS